MKSVFVTSLAILAWSILRAAAPHALCISGRGVLRTLFLALAAAMVVAAMPAMAQYENVRKYGECGVLTIRDYATGEIAYHRLICGQGQPAVDNRRAYFWVSCEPNRRPHRVALRSAGLEWRFLMLEIRVRYRWGMKEAQDVVWAWRGEHLAAYADSVAVAERFLDRMATTDRLAFQVGRDKGFVNIIDIIPASRAAIPDLRARCGEN